MARYNVDVTRNGTQVMVGLGGEVNVSNICELRDDSRLEALIYEEDLVLDFRNLESTDSHFFGWLLSMDNNRRNRGCSGKVIILAKKRMCRLLAAAMLTRLYDIRCPEHVQNAAA